MTAKALRVAPLVQDLRKSTEESVVDPIMQFFNYQHLPPYLQEVSKTFHDLAHWVQANLPRCAERTVALRKLLEAKDAAVRAKVYDPKFEAPKEDQDGKEK